MIFVKSYKVDVTIKKLIIVTTIAVFIFFIGFDSNEGETVFATNNATDVRTLPPELTGARVLTPPTIFDITSNDSLKLTDFTVSAWFRTFNTDIDNAGQHFIVNKGGSGDESPGFNLNYGIWMDNQHRIRAGFEAPSGEDAHLKTNQSFNDFRWHNAVVRHNGTMLDLYIDGTKAHSGVFEIQPDNTGNQQVTIGANSLRFKDFFYGDIDDVRVFNSALSDSQIQQLFNRTYSELPDPVLYKSFGKLLNNTQS